MKMFIAGGTGFLGGHIIKAFLEQGAEVTALVRSGSSLDAGQEGVRRVPGNPLQSGKWQKDVGQADVVINLTGSTIATRWTSEVKRRIMETRVLSTRHVVEGMGSGGGKVLLCASGIGFYGDRGDETLTEESGPGTGFLTEVCLAWEAAAAKAAVSGHRAVSLRMAAVLGPDGGALQKMLPVFRFGLGGKLDSGRQWFPWVHVRDVARAYIFAAEHAPLSGPVNLCGPDLARNERFTKALGHAVHRPTILPVPAFALRLLFGEASRLFLDSERAVPAKLEAAGFSFTFGELGRALEDLV